MNTPKETMSKENYEKLLKEAERIRQKLGIEITDSNEKEFKKCKSCGK